MSKKTYIDKPIDKESIYVGLHKDLPTERPDGSQLQRGDTCTICIKDEDGTIEVDGTIKRWGIFYYYSGWMNPKYHDCFICTNKHQTLLDTGICITCKGQTPSEFKKDSAT